MKKRIRGALWRHKKYVNEYQGSYRFHRGDRSFVLIRAGRFHEVSHESWQAAKKAGWVKQ